MNSQLLLHKFIAAVSPTTRRRSTTIDPERQGKKQLYNKLKKATFSKFYFFVDGFLVRKMATCFFLFYFIFLDGFCIYFNGFGLFLQVKWD
jgi:hypothetical protein